MATVALHFPCIFVLSDDEVGRTSWLFRKPFLVPDKHSLRTVYVFFPPTLLLGSFRPSAGIAFLSFGCYFGLLMWDRFGVPQDRAYYFGRLLLSLAHQELGSVLSHLLHNVLPLY